MIATHSRASGSTSGGTGGKGKDKEKSKSGNGRKCTNCKRKGHIKETCFAKGGGKEHDVPDLWKEKLAKEKKEPEKSANMASKDSKQDDNYALLTIPAEDASHTEDAEDANFALVVTSGHDHQAHAIASSVGVIINCGASSHFSPDRSKFLDYEDIDPEPIKAADGRSFSAIGKGDIRVMLPACNNIQPITIHLKGVYYAPAMAFTLISVSCLDRAGCSLLIEDEVCVIRGPHPKRTTIGAVPSSGGCTVLIPHPSSTLLSIMLTPLIPPCQSMSCTVDLAT